MEAVPSCTMPVTPPEPYQVTQRPTGKESAMASQYTPSWLSCRQETAAAVCCMDATSHGMDVSMQPSMLNFDKDTLATQQFGRSKFMYRMDSFSVYVSCERVSDNGWKACLFV